MAKSEILTPVKSKKQTVMVNVFNGIDRSTARHRIEGKGERLYEAQNIFPYIQGRLQRRRDAVQTNSRDSDNAFPTFPDTSAGGHTGADALVGDPVIRHVADFNDHICIFFEDSGDTGKLLMDVIDLVNNTIDAKIVRSAGLATYAAGGKIDTTIYTVSGSQYLLVSADLTSTVYKIDSSWTITIHTYDAATLYYGEITTFLQCAVVKYDTSRIRRTAPAATTFTTEYQLPEGQGAIIKLLSFGYQTSSAGATSVMLMFKVSSIWVLTGVGATESMEQVTGNIGLIGKQAVTYTPFGICFVGRDTDGLVNLYLLDRNSLVLHTIGHELYEELNDIPKANYSDVVVSFHRNRMIRIAITNNGDSVANNKEYWMDFYNGIKKRSLWGPFTLPASNTLSFAVSMSGSGDIEASGFFMLVKENTSYKLYEDVNTDTYDTTDNEWDDQVWRTKMYDFGNAYGIVQKIIIVALDNDAKFKVYYEKPKTGGDDDDTDSTLIGSFQMGTTGAYISKPIRIVPAILARQIAIKIESNYDDTDNDTFEPSQIGFEYEVTEREVIE